MNFLGYKKVPTHNRREKVQYDDHRGRIVQHRVLEMGMDYIRGKEVIPFRKCDAIRNAVISEIQSSHLEENC